MSFDDLPDDCIRIIIEFLLNDNQTLCNLALLNSKSDFTRISTENWVWKNKYQELEEYFDFKNDKKSRIFINVEKEKNFKRKIVLLSKELSEKFLNIEKKIRKEFRNNFLFNPGFVMKKYDKIENLKDLSLKIVFVGNSTVGKTSLLRNLKYLPFSENCPPTIFDNAILQEVYDGKKINFNLWDTAGHKDYATLRPLSYMGADWFIICFSLVNRKSLESVSSEWLKEIEEFAHGSKIILCGLKKDLLSENRIKTSEVIKYMRKNSNCSSILLYAEFSTVQISACKPLLELISHVTLFLNNVKSFNKTEKKCIIQ